MLATDTPIDIKNFQKRYGLANKDIASICCCSLPTIQKWRSGEVQISGAARQLLRLLESQAEGEPTALQSVLRKINQPIPSAGFVMNEQLADIEQNMTKVMDRLELMLESRRKDKELAASEARYRSMVEACDDPVCRWLPDTTLTYVNKAYAEFFSQHGKNLVGRKWLEFIPEEKRDSIMAIVSDMIRRGEPESMLHEVVNKEGQVRYQEWRDIPILNERGEVMELHSIGHDQTEISVLAREASELRKVRDAMMALCEHPVLVFDEAGSFIEMNSCFKTAILGDQYCSSLVELVSAFPIKKFKRLLKRLSGAEQMKYRMQVGDQLYSLKTRLLFGGSTGNQYLGIFEHEGAEENAKELLQVRLAEEILIGGQNRTFLLDTDLRQKVEESMHTLGMETRVDRIYVFTYDFEEDVFDNVLEWCDVGVESHLEDLKRIPIKSYKWWNRRLLKDQWIQIEDTRKMPGTAALESRILEAQDIRSVLVAPVRNNGQTIGFVGFDQNHDPRIWHSQEIAAIEGFRQMMEEILAGTLGTHN